MTCWRHLVREVHEGAMHMSEDDRLRLGLDQAVMLEQAAAKIREAVDLRKMEDKLKKEDWS